jgi:hypothetical protein
VRAAILAIAVLLWQQAPPSRVLLATVSAGGRLIVDVSIDDFVIEQGGKAGDVIDVHVADYPLAILIDNDTTTPAEFETIREAAARFVARIGERGVVAGTLEGMPLLTTVEDERREVLERLNQAPAASGAATPLEAIASAVRAIQATESPFSAIVVVSAKPIDPASLGSAEALTPIIESKIPVHVIAHRDSAAAAPAGNVTDVLKEVANLTHGQYTTIYTAASYGIALDHLADRLATELMIQFLVPPGAPAGGEVRAGVRLPGARVAGLGVSR